MKVEKILYKKRRRAQLADEVERTYGGNVMDWTEARKDRNGYLIPTNCNNPRLTRIDHFTYQLARMLPEYARIIDIGFGPEGRDIADLDEANKGFQIYGIELVEANIRNALKNPRLEWKGFEERLVQGDIVAGNPFEDKKSDAVILSSVIQHLTPEELYNIVFPRTAGMLKNEGFIQLIFKRSDEETRLLVQQQDKTMGGIRRSFYLYNVDELLHEARKCGLSLFEENEYFFGGIITWDDQTRPEIKYAGMYLQKKNE